MIATSRTSMPLSVQPNFPPGVLAADPLYLQQVYNLSDGTVRGPWNEGEINGMGMEYIYVQNPISTIRDTEGLSKQPEGNNKALADKEKLDTEISQVKSADVKEAEPAGVAQWSNYGAKALN